MGFIRVLFRSERCHAAHSSSGHGLTVNLVAHIARGENTRNTGARGPFFNDDIAFVQRQHAFEQFGRWLVTDGDESAVGWHMGSFASYSVDQSNSKPPPRTPTPPTTLPRHY